MDRRKTLDHNLFKNALTKKAVVEDEKQQAAWEIVQKIKALTILVDHYTDLEETYVSKLKNDTLDHLFTDSKTLAVNREEFISLLKMFKEATIFILKRDMVLQKYQKALDAKTFLEDDPIIQKISSMNSRIKVLESERDQLTKRNATLEKQVQEAHEQEKIIHQLENTVKEKDLEISGLKLDLKQAKEKCSNSETTSKNQISEIHRLESIISQLNNSIETYKVPKLPQVSEYKKLKVFQILAEKKTCGKLLCYLDSSTLQKVLQTSKLIRNTMISHPRFVPSVCVNTYSHRLNIDTTKVEKEIKEIQDNVGANLQPIVTDIKRYLYYNYNVVDLVENLAEDSINQIERLKLDLTEKSKSEETKKGVVSFFKSAMNIKENKQDRTFKFNRVQLIPIDLQTKVADMLSGTPFQRMFLMDLSKTKVDLKPPSDYRAAQNKIFKEQIDKETSVFMSEFTNLILAMGKLWSDSGDSVDSVKDLSMFLVKELGKVYAYIQIVVKDYYRLYKVKEYLFAEMSVYQIKHTIAAQTPRPNPIPEALSRLDEKNSRLENENNRLKINIIDLNDSVVVGFVYSRNKPKRLSL